MQPYNYNKRKQRNRKQIIKNIAKFFVSASILLAGIFFFISHVNNLQNKKDCLKYQRYQQDYPNFKLSNNIKSQCNL